jgi:nucleoside-diphosphate-sugar epimerase
LEDAIALAERLTGIPAPRFRPGPGFLRTLSVLSGLAGNRAAKENFRFLAGTTYLGSNAKAKREFGFTVRPLEEGLRQTLHHEMRLLGMELPKPMV